MAKWPPVPRLFLPLAGSVFQVDPNRHGAIVHWSAQMGVNTRYWELCVSQRPSKRFCTLAANTLPKKFGGGWERCIAGRKGSKVCALAIRKRTPAGSHGRPYRMSLKGRVQAETDRYLNRPLFWSVRACNTPAVCSAWAGFRTMRVVGEATGGNLPIPSEAPPLPD